MAKATVEAPSNIAFVKYWGVEDIDRAIPRAPSLSMTLRRCASRTTVAFTPDADTDDTVLMADAEGTLHPADDGFAEPVVQHLNRLRTWADRSGSFRVATQNSFPAAAGLGSSASGFAALTLAALRALDTWPDAATRSALARQSGSGSAARSVLGGYVAWPHGDNHAAEPVAPHTHWDLRDVIAVVETEPKPVSSRDGHQRAPSSPFYEQRLSHLPERMQTARASIAARDFNRLGPLIETEGIELHLITMSSQPPIYYWKPATLKVLEVVRAMRSDGLAAYATMDAGANVHVICPPEDEPQVAARLDSMHAVHMVIRDGVGPGPTTDVDPLF
jgi:diphosphomevalonate decarboxylase